MGCFLAAGHRRVAEYAYPPQRRRTGCSQDVGPAGAAVPSDAQQPGLVCQQWRSRPPNRALAASQSELAVSR